MLDGVIIKPLSIFSDDRGYLMEVFKEGDEVAKTIAAKGAAIKQTTYTLSYPGIIKAFHLHKRQFDIWFFPSGNAQVVLHDLRKDSPTYKQTQVIFAGEQNRMLICIPPFVAHGYKVLGQTPACLLYHTTEPFDPANPDEERFPWDSKDINFDWTTKFK